jgi:hypothetical protein
MAATHGCERLFLVAKRVVQFGVPLGLAAWIALWFVLGSLGLPELFVLMGAPLLIGATIWFIAWIVEGFMLPHGGKQQ